MKKLISLAIIIGSVFLLSGCSPRIQVDIDSIGNHPNYSKSYILSSGMNNINDNDLQFKEYAGYVNNALKEKGYQLSDFGDANIGVMLTYGISEPQIEHEYVANSKISNDKIKTRIETISNESYNRYITIQAIDLITYRATKEMKPIWKVKMISTGTSSDLRLIFPVMIGAGKEYIGTNTGKSIRIVISENDDRVLVVKNK